MRNPDENRLQLAEDWLDDFDPPPAKDVKDVRDIGDIVMDVNDLSDIHEMPVFDDDDDQDGETVPRSLPAPSSRARRCEHCSGELVRSQRQKLDRLVSFGSGRRPYRCVDCRRRTWH
jgi:hypothetical protein